MANLLLSRQEAKWAEAKRVAEPLPADLCERLIRARDKLRFLLRRGPNQQEFVDGYPDVEASDWTNRMEWLPL